MIHDVLSGLEALRATERRVAMATLVSATGSQTRMIGAKTFVGESGRIVGTVTIGGCVDARAIEASDDVLANGAAALLTLALADEEAWDLGLGCGGDATVLIEAVDCTRDEDPVVAAYTAVRRALEAGEPAVVVRALNGGAQRMVLSGDAGVSGSLGDVALDARLAPIARGHSGGGARIVRDDVSARDYFLEAFAPPLTAIVYGAGEVATSLSRIAHEIGMRVVIVDARARYATRERFPDADDIRIGAPEAIAAALPATRDTCVVIVAHDYKYELPVLRHALRAPVRYIGLLASRKRAQAMREFLAGEGFTAEELARIHAPIGLDIGARSPSEIALSIAGELVAVGAGKATRP
jgi:xanthine dehydrogenase accessory factor